MDEATPTVWQENSEKLEGLKEEGNSRNFSDP